MEKMSFDIESDANIKERLQYYCELTKANEEKTREDEKNRERKEG